MLESKINCFSQEALVLQLSRAPGFTSSEIQAGYQSWPLNSCFHTQTYTSRALCSPRFLSCNWIDGKAMLCFHFFLQITVLLLLLFFYASLSLCLCFLDNTMSLEARFFLPFLIVSFSATRGQDKCENILHSGAQIYPGTSATLFKFTSFPSLHRGKEEKERNWASAQNLKWKFYLSSPLTTAGIIPQIAHRLKLTASSEHTQTHSGRAHLSDCLSGRDSI